MAGSIARVLGVGFKRVQFTPDTMPEEITGKNVTRGGETTFQPGAAFTNILLADEINRTPPRTQAALLEAMQERHVTVEGRTHWLPSPFMVIATQNPYEQAGIFPLPESQLDRFLFKIHLDYASAAVERAILRLPHRGLAPDVLGDVQPLLDVARLQTRAGGSRRDAGARRRGRLHRRHRPRHPRDVPGVVLGASPRAAVHLLAAAKAHARLANRADRGARGRRRDGATRSLASPDRERRRAADRGPGRDRGCGQAQVDPGLTVRPDKATALRLSFLGTLPAYVSIDGSLPVNHAAA